MKRKTALMFLFTIIFSMLFALPAKAADTGYEITKMQVDVVVDEARVYYVTETITVNFIEERRGIMRNIFTIGESESYTVENINVEGAPFTISESATTVDIRIGDPNTYITGEITYVITYEMHHYQDYLGNGDYIYINLIGPSWDTNILEFEGSITYPQNAVFERLVITSGEAHSTTNSANIQYTHEGNTIYFNSADKLRPSEAVTANIRLNEGAFSTAPEFVFPYTIESMNTIITLTKAKEFEVEQSFTFTVDDVTELRWRSEGYEVHLPVVVTSTQDEIKNISSSASGVSDVTVRTTSSSGNLVYVQEAGTYTVQVQYTVVPPLESNVNISLIRNLMVPIENTTITLNSEVSLNNISITRGRYNEAVITPLGAEENSDNGQTFTINVQERISPADQLVIKADVPLLSFRRPVHPAMLALMFASVLMVAISVAIFLRFGKDDPIIPVVEVYPPDGMNSPEIGFVNDENTNSEKMTSVIYNWASAGYLQIEEDEKGKVKLRKLKEMGAERPDYELQMFNGMFSLGAAGAVTAKQLSQSFYTYISSGIGEVRKKFKTEPTEMYEKNAVYQSAILAMAMLPLIAYYFIAKTVLGVRSILSIAGVDTILILYFIVIMFLSVRGVITKATKGAAITLIMNLFPMMAAIFVFYASFSLETGFSKFPKLPFYVAAISSGAMFILAWVTKKRSAYGVSIKGRVQGFKEFLQVAEKDRLEMLLEQDPEYFYNILPYAQVLGVSKQWQKRFAEITLLPPTWYITTNERTINTNNLTRDITRKVNSFSKTASRSPSSSGGGSDSYGGSSGGGYSDGGSSGGGSGGGGGSSW